MTATAGPVFRRLASGTVTSSEESEVVCFNTGERSIEYFPARYHDDVEAGRNFVTPENLSGDTLGAISIDSGAELPRSRYSES